MAKQAKKPVKKVVKKSVKKSAKYVYAFGGGKADGNGSMKPLLGGKGANLAEMCRIGLPVPPGFTITTEVCTAFYANDRQYPAELKGQVKAALATGVPFRSRATAPGSSSRATASSR